MKNKEQQMSDLLVTLRRLKREAQTPHGSGLDKRSQAQYDEKISQFTSMRDGGDGGMFRQTETTIRELHYNGWQDQDFQTMLESLGEVDVMSDEERAERWPDERGFFKKTFDSLFGK